MEQTAAPTNYVENAELRTLARQARDDGRLSPRLADLMYKMIDGFLDRFAVMIPADDRADFRQDCIIHLYERAVPRIFERGGNPFAYMTEAVKNFARDCRTEEVKRLAQGLEFAAAAEEAGNLYSVDEPELYRPTVATTRPRTRVTRKTHKQGVRKLCRSK